ncbi:hypothetical protein F2P81_010783 [Scophthalmus maximus]|uniref:High-affinity choline transporter 1-like n=1 Tax=Scophthalmus maximus TaxID=52904 RepID=A0A6A4SYW1_SCOMX|nr:hypothetical protein F2P81_010783 [Scophthalmus maximus]
MSLLHSADQLFIEIGTKRNVSKLNTALYWTLNNTGATMSVILDLPYVYTVKISSAVAIIYTLLGGLYSVAYTDIIQLSLAFLSLCFHQRTLSASSSQTAQLTCYAAPLMIAILGIPPVLVGAVAASTDWNLTLYGSPSPFLRGEKMFILPLNLQYLTPSYISITGIGAVGAAVMSSTDSGLLSATSILSSNIYKNILRKEASDYEMQWVIRITVVVVGVVGTSITFFTNSTLVLWILGADISYTLIFPHLVCVLFVGVTNAYGAMVGYVIGLIVRILLGEYAPFGYRDYMNSSIGDKGVIITQDDPSNPRLCYTNCY